MVPQSLRTSRILLQAVLFVSLMANRECSIAEDEPPAPSIEIGKELFTRDWSKHKPTRGDGLGPMFNAVSCVECHQMGGVGGAGKVDHNVDLLSLVSPRPKPGAASPRTVKRIRSVHPDLNASRLSVTLHKAGYRRQQDVLQRDPDYDKFRKSLKDEKHAPTASNPAFVQHLFRQRMKFELSERATPALFGAGVIDMIPDLTLIKLAQHQKENVQGISGRVPQTPSGAVGRFGWRGQIASLHEFVLGACVNELGLQVAENQPEPVNPIETLAWLNRNGSNPPGLRSSRFKHLTVQLTEQPPGGPDVVDLSASECRSLTVFVASLPAPVQLNGVSLSQSQAALEGQQLFEKIGCSECHVRDVGPAKGIYSDLLLHDMGPTNADAVSAVPELDDRTTPFASGYMGGFVTEKLVRITTKINQEWRTPPLWGVRDSAPYLHDGRAINLDDAIRMHSGEAGASARRYRSLGALDRDRVIAFLSTLAPQGATPRAVFFPGGRRQGQGSAFGSGFFSVGKTGGSFDAGSLPVGPFESSEN